MVKNLYWFWESEISPAVCDLLLSEVDLSQAKKALVGFKNTDSTGYDESFRKTDVIWQAFIKPFGCILYTHAQTANESAGWNFDIIVPENTQITIYHPGCFYNWHVDSFPTSQTHIRKVTNILFLSDPKEYKGGELLLRNNSISDVIELKPPKGSIISFPSFIEHRVNEVTSGKRITAVSWVTGPLFK